ncbi:hypothetical protein BCR39DRAFT_541575 [Naematelia encephala]|uniref:Uncharacterized protein n=1 Tax=Naematelia encephala TaxID=71784 RepID=A0A1Y2AUL2_9TREE|nr:hypothetical protein BCR39DRAFT_541575 [Naematelia encephala]
MMRSASQLHLLGRASERGLLNRLVATSQSMLDKDESSPRAEAKSWPNPDGSMLPRGVRNSAAVVVVAKSEVFAADVTTVPYDYHGEGDTKGYAAVLLRCGRKKVLESLITSIKEISATGDQSEPWPNEFSDAVLSAISDAATSQAVRSVGSAASTSRGRAEEPAAWSARSMQRHQTLSLPVHAVRQFFERTVVPQLMAKSQGRRTRTSSMNSSTFVHSTVPVPQLDVQFDFESDSSPAPRLSRGAHTEKDEANPPKAVESERTLLTDPEIGLTRSSTNAPTLPKVPTITPFEITDADITNATPISSATRALIEESLRGSETV